jgi:hypothetical protein
MQEYLRYPSSWKQVSNNLIKVIEGLDGLTYLKTLEL